MATFKCPICGAPCLSPKEMANHCANNPHYAGMFQNSGRACPDCKGSGEKYDWLGSKMICPRCGGTGKI